MTSKLLSDPKFAGDFKDAMTELRIGELRIAVAILSKAITEKVSSVALPAYSDGIKLSMNGRRNALALALEAVGDELKALAKTILEQKTAD